MSSASVTIINEVQIRLTEDEANILKSILYRTNWAQFPFAESVVDQLTEAGIVDEIDLFWNEDESQLER